VFGGFVEIAEQGGAEPSFMGSGCAGELAGVEVAAGFGAEVGEVELVAGEGVGGKEEEEAGVGVGDFQVGDGEVDEGVGAGDEGFLVEVDAGRRRPIGRGVCRGG